MLAVSTIGILLLKNDFNTSIDMQTKNAISEHSYMVSNISNKIVAARLQSNSILLTTSQILGVLGTIFEDSKINPTTIVALFNKNHRVLYNNVPISLDVAILDRVMGNDQEISKNEGDTDSSSRNNIYYTQILKIDKRMRLIVASPIVLEKQNFIFVTSTDISNIYTSYNSQIRYTKYMCISLSLVCAIILLTLSKLLLRPLANLNRTTAAIATGDYSQRISIYTDDELGELSKNMNIMANAVEENVCQLKEVADNRKTFINNLSHEMKTPLTSILGFADIIRIKRNLSEEELYDYSNIIFDEATRLKNLSGKLMELITIGETNLDFTGIDTADLFSQIELVMKPIMESASIPFTVSCDVCRIHIDLELFKSMIFNLLDNAIKASEKDSPICLTGRKKQDHFEFLIMDKGIGMSEDDISKVTEPFYMVDKARSRKAGGAGLGLALCVSIAEIHGASFHIASKLNEGTTVTISIPISEKGVEKNENQDK